jgi:uncharacterized coiled-coil protein SlyX
MPDLQPADPLAPEVVAMAEPAPAAIDLAAFEHALAVRDEQIAELQQAVIELADMRAAAAATEEAEPVADVGTDAELIKALSEAAGRIAALEDRSVEQERLIRHVLTMMIEFIEGEPAHRAAA